MAYLSKCALLTVAIALAVFIPVCDAFAHQKIPTGAFKSMAARLMNTGAQDAPGRQLMECESGEYLTITCNATAEEAVDFVFMKMFSNPDTTCGGTPEKEVILNATEFTELSAMGGADVYVNLEGCVTITNDSDDTDATQYYGAFKCRSNIIEVDLHDVSSCTNFIATANNSEVDLDACNCEDDDDDDEDLSCTDSCTGYPSNCTEFGTFLSTGCAATCMASDRAALQADVRQAYLLGEAPDLSSCTAAFAALDLKVSCTDSCTTGYPSNCTEFGTFLSTGCAATCMASDAAKLRADFEAANLLSLLNCTAEFIALALKTSSATGGFWHMASIVAALPLLFALGY